MALERGQASVDPVTGLAGRIYTAWTGDPDAGFLKDEDAPAEVLATARKCIAATCEAIAKAVIDEITANAEVDLDTGEIS